MLSLLTQKVWGERTDTRNGVQRGRACEGWTMQALLYTLCALKRPWQACGSCGLACTQGRHRPKAQAQGGRAGARWRKRYQEFQPIGGVSTFARLPSAAPTIKVAANMFGVWCGFSVGPAEVINNLKGR